MRKMLSWTAAVLAAGIFAALPAYSGSQPIIQQVTQTTLCENFQPMISGDGKKIVFLADCEIIPGSNADRNYEVFLYDIENRSFVQITETAAPKASNTPSINQDGSLVAFRSTGDLVPGKNKDGNPEIFVYAAKSKTLKQITRTAPPAVNSGPSLSGDGKRIVFFSTAEFSEGENPGRKMQAVLYESKSGRFKQLTHAPAAPAPTGIPGLPVSGVSLSWDGTKAIIVSSLDLAKGKNPDGAMQFFLYHTKTGSVDQVTHNTGRSEPGHSHGVPSLSEDGSKIAYLSTADSDHARHGEGNQAVFLLDTASGSATQIAEAEKCQIQNVAMNGKGTLLSFAATCDFTGGNKDPGSPNMEVFVYDVEKKSFLQLTHTLRDFNHTPSVDRNGSRIAFGSDRDIHRGKNLDENSEIFLATLPRMKP